MEAVVLVHEDCINKHFKGCCVLFVWSGGARPVVKPAPPHGRKKGEGCLRRGVIAEAPWILVLGGVRVCAGSLLEHTG